MRLPENFKKAVVFWFIGYCLYIVKTRILHVVVAKNLDFTTEVSPLMKLNYSASYHHYLPYLFIVSFTIWAIIGFLYYYGREFETPHIIKKASLRIAIFWFFMTLIFDNLLWSVLDTPMKIPFQERYAQDWIYFVLIYLACPLGALIGIRPYYLQKKKH